MGLADDKREIFSEVADVSDTIDANFVTGTCSCTSGKCMKCQCSKNKLACLVFCKCKRYCLYKPI